MRRTITAFAAGSLGILVGCSGWQRSQVTAAVEERLDCEASHVVVRGPVRADASDGLPALEPGAKVWRGACDLWWDERVVVRCDDATRTCRVVDVGAPHQRSEDRAR
jgi:hypothetical protein